MANKSVCFVWQWLFGFVLFLVPGASEGAKSRMLPWHMFWGRLLLLMAICAALTGLMEKSSFLKLQHHRENHLMNFTGLSILLFGIFVDLSAVLAHYVYWYVHVFVYLFIYLYFLFWSSFSITWSSVLVWNFKLFNSFGLEETRIND